MGMRIRTNVTSLLTQRNVANNTKDLGDSIEKLASGYRINQSKDDSAGLAISENMRAKIRGLNQAKRNANDAVSMIQVAEGGMSETSNILVRMRELAVQASTDTIGDTERSFLNKEYVQLGQEIDRIAATTEFNGNKFFVQDPDNPKTQYTIQVGNNWKDGEVNTNTISMNLEGLKFTAADMGIGNGNEIGPSTIGDTAPSREEIAQKLGVLDNALSRIATERATIGSIQSRLGSTVNNLMTSVENLGSARSRIVDVDFAEETSNLAQRKILSQSSIAVLAQANQTPEMVLSLLR